MKTTNTEWRGYNLEELRYARAVNMARREIQKSRLQYLTAQTTEQIKDQARPSALISRVAGAINYVDYAVMAFTIFKKILPLFRKHSR